MIKKDFRLSHGSIVFDKTIYKYPVIPHLKKYDKNFIYTGDTLRSIHPVAGQGWNLGIKDIQTLCKLTEQYQLDDKSFNSVYYARRMIESIIYLGFTSLINYAYENPQPISKSILKVGYKGLINFKFLREIFIKQAMGRINLID